MQIHRRGLGIFAAFMVVLIIILSPIIVMALKGLALLAALLILFFLLSFLLITYQAWERHNRRYRNSAYEFNHWGMTITGNTPLSFPWRSIRKIKESEKFFIFLTDNTTHIVLKRMFRNEAERVAFKRFLKEKMNS